ncbi:MAG TPA: glycosyltransferase family 4 protein [Nitrospiraceae bacterium]|nr:glycosyltransferase family 4 protein [Nitrospiraceae bacterium]
MMRTKAGQGEPDDESVAILISANSFWNIRNFRGGLIDALVEQGWRVIIAAPGVDREWAAERRAEAVELRIDRSGTNPVRDLALIANFHRLILKSRPIFLLGFTAKPNIYGSLAARFSGVVCLPNVSGLGTAFINPGPLSALVGALYRLAFAKCPLVFFQNGEDCEMFVRRKIVRPDQVRLLPGSGVDLDRFRPAPPDRSAGVRFLLVGRLLGDKGVREFVEAARSLRSRHPDWRFQLLGPIDGGNRSGIAQPELDRWIDEGTIDYLGRTDDVRPYIAASTAVVLPSYREGLPRSLLEAAAMARPLIATDVPGNRRIVEHGINGLLCAVRDPASLAEAMSSIGLMEADQREAMGRAGRATAEREFSEGRVVNAYLDAIGQLSAVARS